MFYVELTRARDNVVLLTDDREALIEALETSPAEELSALRAIGEQFEAPEEIVQQHTLHQRAAVLDDATRERRRAAERFVAQALSAGVASIRERDARAREAHSHDAHVTLAPGCQSAFSIDPQSACKIDPPECHGGGCPGSQ